ncbi:CNT family concentrative nucleoside transporter [Deinococcus sp. HSC-46F16]|uniref:NupC/NupG family nucleoside CNT transporter n=1 Tax=Deinococcus sp. HSC-46F16 TaxID=2910968 RepID=UPI0020A07431|nr:NupC/NupG family nucleoside CNT transporter [Deinococcus sp. HSC-46F16]MCP2014216.1 CNT family concentrative nucleoside transporter [Deinococcus sp. HSC-46F16]
MTDILWGLGGMAVLLGLALLLSTDRRAVNWRTVLGALAIQVAFALIVLRWPLGRRALDAVSAGVQAVVGNAQEGINFVFGNLTNGALEGAGFIFAFGVLPVIVFFSALIAVLYHIGVMQAVVRVLGGGLSKLLGTSRGESLSATANIFVGQTEAPLVVRPYIERMTRSELFAVMVGGLASVAGSVLVGYSLLGVRLDYLIAASFMAAPAGLLMAKLMLPEKDTPQNYKGEVPGDPEGGPVNAIDAAARGASDGLGLALNVGAMLIAFIGLIALLNTLLGALGGVFGFPDLSVQLLLGYLFAPLAFVIGVPWGEAATAGSFIGQKLVTNEFVAFVEFADALKEGAFSPKVEAIITFALCGFANLSSLAILLGGLGSLAPSRRGDIAQLGLRAVAAGTLANLLSGTLAGMLIG